MVFEKDELSEISSFLNKYHLECTNEDTTIIRSKENNFLIKNMRTTSQDLQHLDTIEQTLEQHQQFNQQYILTLLEWEIVEYCSSGTYIRAIYQYGCNNLKEEINIRKNNKEHFEQQEIWMIVQALVKALAYLEEHGIVYGVLGTDRIFIDESIKILDPSATATDPLLITADRLYSPQLLNNQQGIDMFKSDTYVLGLCLLEIALLIDLAEQQTINIKKYLQQFNKLYCSELGNLLCWMLQQNAVDRPNFLQLRTYLIKQFEMQESYIILQECQHDKQDKINIIDNFQQKEQEYFDILYDQDNNNNNTSRQISQYQKAKIKFIYQQQINYHNNTTINSLCDLNHDKFNNSTEKTMNKTKKIKDKLIRCTDMSQSILLNRQQLFTDPNLMQMIQNDMAKLSRTYKLPPKCCQLQNQENIWNN